MDLNENKDVSPKTDAGKETSDGFDFVLNDDTPGGESGHHHHHHHHGEHHASGEHHSSENKTKNKKTKKSAKKKSPVKKLFGKLSDEISVANSRKQKSPVEILKNKYERLTPSKKKSIVIALCAVSAIIVLCLAFLILKSVHTHSYGEWMVVSDATCAKPGEQIRKCWCGEEQSDYIIVDHVFGDPELDTVDGNMVYMCNVCGTEKREIPDYSDLGLPVLNLKGDLAGVSKGKYTGVEVTYSSEKTSFESSGQVKLQGATSIGFEKTNYT